MVKLLVLKSRAYFAKLLSWRLVFCVLVFEQLDVTFVMVVVMAGLHGHGLHDWQTWQGISCVWCV
jgi:hypothetical protein